MFVAIRKVVAKWVVIVIWETISEWIVVAEWEVVDKWFGLSKWELVSKWIEVDKRGDVALSCGALLFCVALFWVCLFCVALFCVTFFCVALFCRWSRISRETTGRHDQNIYVDLAVVHVGSSELYLGQD